MDLKDFAFDVRVAWVNFLLKFPHHCTYCRHIVWPSQHPWRVKKKWYHKECYERDYRETEEQMLKRVLDPE